MSLELLFEVWCKNKIVYKIISNDGPFQLDTVYVFWGMYIPSSANVLSQPGI